MARRSNLSRLSVRDLETELARRKRQVGSLVRKHRRLLDKANRVADQIEELGGSVNGAARGHRRSRPRNDTSLVEVLGKVLKGKTMGAAEAAEAVQKAGYRSSAKSFRTVVSIALINSGKFKRVERGRYTAK
jgi:hypothetical protein